MNPERGIWERTPQIISNGLSPRGVRVGWEQAWALVGMNSPATDGGVRQFSELEGAIRGMTIWRVSEPWDHYGIID